MTDRLSVIDEDEWIDLADAAPRLGFDPATLLRHLQAGGLPVMQLRGERRTAHRIPRDFVEQARRIVFEGGQVELREFARTWGARNSSPTAAAAVA